MYTYKCFITIERNKGCYRKERVDFSFGYNDNVNINFKKKQIEQLFLLHDNRPPNDTSESASNALRVA